MSILVDEQTRLRVHARLARARLRRTQHNYKDPDGSFHRSKHRERVWGKHWG